jgi:TRAP-type uncharacterized transport system substrate-binding protein
MHVSEEVVYQVTKGIWEIHEVASWLKNTIKPETALGLISGSLHPSAERYYREFGLEIPPVMNFWTK